jgi:glyoxylase-like metal-dependent hydrolase (beta-lactamase superfamily II)
MSYYTSLEDLFGDIVGKALRGQGLAAQEVERRSGISAGDIARITDGGFAPEDPRVQALADALGLHGGRLVESAHRAWVPKSPDGAFTSRRVGVERLEIEGSVQMNSYIFWDTETKEATFVDPGDQADRILAVVQKRGLQPVKILLTHGHGDHTGALKQVKESCHIPAFINDRDLPLIGGLRSLIDGNVEDGWQTRVGGLEVRAASLPGHTPGGVGYGVEDVLFSGDALFAGSLGGTRSLDAYTGQLRAVRQKALGLPGWTTIFPGHGPATTVAEELAHNPFFLR